MPWDLDNNRPIYLQLMEKIQQDIISGVYHAGDRLPSVRELALEASVNPNTVRTGTKRACTHAAYQRSIYYGG